MSGFKSHSCGTIAVSWEQKEESKDEWKEDRTEERLCY
jgi:hypothetical protein